MAYTLNKAFEALSIAHSAGEKIEETNKKLGYINEQTFRHHLNTDEGLPWARGFTH